MRAELEAYTEAERVFETIDSHQSLLCHAKGKFLYRLAGRARKKSASYYTPESLTRCLVEIQQTDLKLDDTVVNVDKLCTQSPRLALVRTLANERKFFHWELEFIDLFARRGGFDLILGKPTTLPSGTSSTPLPNSKFKIQHSKFPMPFTLQNRETD